MAAPMSGSFDGNLCDILQNVQQIDAFLDVIFEFLHRRTDFYKLMRDNHDTMGLPPGTARKLVMKAFMKYEKIGQGLSRPDAIQQGGDHVAHDVPEPIKTVEIHETAEDDKQKSKTVDDGGRPEEEEDATRGRDRKQDEDMGSPEERRRKRIDTMITPSDTYNGALRTNYCWSQTMRDVDVKVFVPESLKKAKDLIVSIQDESIKVAIRGHSVGAAEPVVLIDSKLTKKIRCDLSMWSLHPQNYVQLSLEKLKEGWWHSVTEDEPPIDNKTIDNVQSVGDMDEEAQQEYRRVVFDMEQKRKGNPTSKEMETHGILRKAWNAEGSPFKGTEFDPSSLNIST